MTEMKDAVTTVKTLLSTYFDTDNITDESEPEWVETAFKLVNNDTYEAKIYKRVTDLSEIGRGSHFDQSDLVTIDLRGRAKSDTTFNEIRNEIYRVLAVYRTAPGGGYHYLRWVNEENLSFRGHNFLRIQIDIELNRYGVSKE